MEGNSSVDTKKATTLIHRKVDSIPRELSEDPKRRQAEMEIQRGGVCVGGRNKNAGLANTL